MSKVSIDPRHLEALRQFKAQVFWALSHPTRIHIVETLREGELSVAAILDRVKVEPPNLSQHLSILRSKQLLFTRKEGNQVIYSLRDPLLIDVLDTMRVYFKRHFKDAIQILKSVDAVA